MAKDKAVADIRPKPAERRLRPKSGTGYPYYNLDESIAVADAVQSKGGGQCGVDQLASFLSYSTTRSGAYLTRVAAAKMFGFINTDSHVVTLTELARKILSPVFREEATQARIDAFLRVPLFGKVYEDFRGRSLPPEIGMKNAFKTQYQIVNDRLTPAYRILMESAEQAGFFSTNGDKSRLIRPLVKPQDGPPARDTSADSHEGRGGKDTSETGGGPGGSGDRPPLIHPAIVGLLQELPKPGESWGAHGKSRFKKAFEAMLDVIYPTDDDGGQESPRMKERLARRD